MDFTFNVNIQFMVSYPTSSKKILLVKISFDNNEWYNSINYQNLAVDATSEVDSQSIQMSKRIFPCIWMYEKDTEVQILNYTP
jgi:hypothetical protein